MAQNPYSAAISRWFTVVLGVAGSALSAAVAVRTLYMGSTNGCFTGFCILTRTWSAHDYPTQFWFYVLFWAVAAGIFGRVAWKAWQE